MPPQVLRIGPSCHECRRRKIKCDRSIPCSYCVKTRIQCVYPDSALESGTADQTQEYVLDRIEGIEKKLESLEQGISDIKQLLQSNLSTTFRQNHGSRKRPAINLDGFSSMNMDMELSDTSALDLSPDLSSFIELRHTGEKQSEKSSNRVPAFLSTGSLPALSSLHPSPGMVVFMMQKFIDTVDPLLKLLHMPTTQRQIINATRALDRVEPHTECIMFAVYYVTLVGMSREDCQSFFAERKEVLLNRYRAGIEIALARVDILNSPTISSLQAFVLYISGRIRDNQDGPDVHTLTGIAIQRALRLKLHHHGTILSCLPFEAEIRRRLWWHICILDVCIAAAAGTEPLILEKSFNTPFPSNLNDSCLNPDMKELPLSTSTSNKSTSSNLMMMMMGGKSEIFFSLLRFEIGYFARQIIFSEQFCRYNAYAVLSKQEKEDAIDAFRARIESQYLTYFDAITAFDDRVVIAARSILDTMKNRVSASQTDSSSGIDGLDEGMKIDIDLREVIIDLAGPVVHPSFIPENGENLAA